MTLQTSTTDPIERGYTDGIERVSYSFGAVHLQALLPQIHEGRSQIRSMVELSLSNHPNSNPEFVRLFAELVTIAHSARLHYHEEALYDSQVQEFCNLSINFLNSFTHLP